MLTDNVLNDVVDDLAKDFHGAELLIKLAASPDLMAVLQSMQGGRAAVASLRLEGVPDEAIDMLLRAGASLLLNMALLTQQAGQMIAAEKPANGL
jgi:hypothetical protein